MKKLLPLLLVFTLLLSDKCLAAYVGNQPVQAGAVSVLDTSSSNLASTYTTNGQLFTGLTKKSKLSVYNASSKMILGCTTSTASNCSGGTDNFLVPPGGTVTVDVFTIGGKICVRSQSGTISTGLIGAMVW